MKTTDVTVAVAIWHLSRILLPSHLPPREVGVHLHYIKIISGLVAPASKKMGCRALWEAFSFPSDTDKLLMS